MLKLEENENGITDEASVFLLSMPYGGKVEGWCLKIAAKPLSSFTSAALPLWSPEKDDGRCASRACWSGKGGWYVCKGDARY